MFKRNALITTALAAVVLLSSAPYGQAAEVEVVVYDNGFDRPIDGGSIKIHTNAVEADLVNYPLDHVGAYCQSDGECDDGDNCTQHVYQFGSSGTAATGCACDDQEQNILSNPDFLEDEGALSVYGSASEGKVAVCHVPPGNPDNFHTIWISEEDVEAHLAEHPLDYEGECVEPDVSCSEEDSLLLIDPAFLEDDGALAICGNESKGNKNKFAKCLSEEVGISESCGDCYGEFSKCWKKTCEDICSSGDGEACESCVNNTDCDENFESCAGFEYPAPPLFQSTYKKYTCDRRWGGRCEWKKDYRLGPFKTKEFRFYCSNENLRPTDAGIKNRKDSTSCTLWFPFYDGDGQLYLSKSCTNWDMTSGDRVTPWVKCEIDTFD
jgi:hypothetical protein